MNGPSSASDLSLELNDQTPVMNCEAAWHDKREDNRLQSNDW